MGGLRAVRFVACRACPRGRSTADGIVALTGGGERLDAAVALFESGVGKRLLISGVDPATTKAMVGASPMAGGVSIAAPISAMRRRTPMAMPQEAANWAAPMAIKALSS